MIDEYGSVQDIVHEKIIRDCSAMCSVPDFKWDINIYPSIQGSGVIVEEGPERL